LKIEFKLAKKPKKAAKKYSKDLDIKNRDINTKVLPLEVVADRSMFYDVG